MHIDINNILMKQLAASENNIFFIGMKHQPICAEVHRTHFLAGFCTYKVKI